MCISQYWVCFFKTPHTVSTMAVDPFSLQNAFNDQIFQISYIVFSLKLSHYRYCLFKLHFACLHTHLCSKRNTKWLKITHKNILIHRHPKKKEKTLKNDLPRGSWKAYDHSSDVSPGCNGCWTYLQNMGWLPLLYIYICIDNCNYFRKIKLTEAYCSISD